MSVGQPVAARPIDTIGRPRAATVVGLLVVGLALVIYWLSNRFFDAGRGDFFYLADAFLHGRTWLDVRPGPWDVIVSGPRFYVPFAPLPAIAFMPLVAVTGPIVADQWESGINAALAAASVGMAWWLLGRVGVRALVDRIWLVVLFGFSTAIWWVTDRGGVWHTGHLIATILTFGCLIELWGRQRAWLIGFLGGAAFLTRAPLAFALPFYALMLEPERKWAIPTSVAGEYVERVRSWPWRSWVGLTAGALPAIVIFFFYNQVRFGSFWESGYALATLPDWLAARRDQGLFSIAHVAVNVDYLLLHWPKWTLDFPFVHPDGLGMSVLLTSPGLLLGVRADWSNGRSWLLVGAAGAVLVPTLLYYGGGWLQYGYRYFLDSIPFVICLCGIAAARLGAVGWGWRALITLGVAVNALGVYWTYHL